MALALVAGVPLVPGSGSANPVWIPFQPTALPKPHAFGFVPPALATRDDHREGRTPEPSAIEHDGVLSTLDFPPQTSAGLEPDRFLSSTPEGLPLHPGIDPRDAANGASLPPPSDAADPSAGAGGVASRLRPLVNLRRGGTGPATATAPPPTEGDELAEEEPAHEPRAAGYSGELESYVRASVAELLLEHLEPTRREDGTVTFSLLGIGRFSLEVDPDGGVARLSELGTGLGMRYASTSGRPAGASPEPLDLGTPLLLAPPRLDFLSRDEPLTLPLLIRFLWEEALGVVLGVLLAVFLVLRLIERVETRRSVPAPAPAPTATATERPAAIPPRPRLPEAPPRYRGRRGGLWAFVMSVLESLSGGAVRSRTRRRRRRRRRATHGSPTKLEGA
jgi:hypothetical protein